MGGGREGLYLRPLQEDLSASIVQILTGCKTSVSYGVSQTGRHLLLVFQCLYNIIHGILHFAVFLWDRTLSVAAPTYGNFKKICIVLIVRRQLGWFPHTHPSPTM